MVRLRLNHDNFLYLSCSATYNRPAHADVISRCWKVPEKKETAASGSIFYLLRNHEPAVQSRSGKRRKRRNLHELVRFLLSSSAELRSLDGDYFYGETALGIIDKQARATCRIVKADLMLRRLDVTTCRGNLDQIFPAKLSAHLVASLKFAFRLHDFSANKFLLRLQSLSTFTREFSDFLRVQTNREI